MRSLPPARNQLRIRCLYVLWRQDFHRVIVSGKCKLKTRTHMGKLAAHVSCGDEISSCRRDVQVGKLAPTSLVATRFHLVGEVQVENSHPHGKTCTHRLKTCTHVGKLAALFGDGTQRTRFHKADQTSGKRCRSGCVNCKSRTYETR